METHLFQSINCINLKTYFNLVFIQDKKYLKKYIIRIVFWILYRIKYLEKQYFCNFRSHDFLSVFFTTFSPVNFSVFYADFLIFYEFFLPVYFSLFLPPREEWNFIGNVFSCFLRPSPWTILGQQTRLSQILHYLPHPSPLSTRMGRGGINGTLCTLSSRFSIYSLKCTALPMEENKFRNFDIKFRIFREIIFSLC